LTKIINRWLELLDKRWEAWLNILGGSKLKFIFKSPHGEEHHNSLCKLPLDLEKNCPGVKIDQFLLIDMSGLLSNNPS